MFTTTSSSVLGVITARGGSKSIHKKSIALCAGMPLLVYTIEAAKRATGITRLILSTDDDEIAAVADAHGVERGPDQPVQGVLARDIIAFQAVMTTLEREEGYIPDAVVHLRPTTPLKKSTDIDRGINLLLENPAADSVRSVCAPLHTPFKMYHPVSEAHPYLTPLLKPEFPTVFEEFDEPYNMPRQALPAVLRHSGYVDVVRPSVLKRGLMSGDRIVPLLIEEWRDVDIDSLRDLKFAEQIILELRERGVQPWD